MTSLTLRMRWWMAVVAVVAGLSAVGFYLIARLDLRPFVVVGVAVLLFGLFIVGLAWVLGKPHSDDQAA